MIWLSAICSALWFSAAAMWVGQLALPQTKLWLVMPLILIHYVLAVGYLMLAVSQAIASSL